MCSQLIKSRDHDAKNQLKRDKPIFAEEGAARAKARQRCLYIYIPTNTIILSPFTLLTNTSYDHKTNPPRTASP